MKSGFRLLLVPLLFLVMAATPVTPASKAVTDQVVCVLCGDYTFDEKQAARATFEGKQIHLCSMNELELLKKRPDLVWGVDPVNGHRVNKIHTVFTSDRKVKVQKNSRIEMWNRRFFFESAVTRDAFLKSPERFTREPYQEK